MALVDRWRPETHTFQFSWGDIAPSLKDVYMLLERPLEGEPISLTVLTLDEDKCLTEFDKRFGAAFSEEVLVDAYMKNGLDAHRKNKSQRKGKNSADQLENLKIQTLASTNEKETLLKAKRTTIEEPNKRNLVGPNSREPLEKTKTASP